METAGLRPSMKSTSGLSIWPRNWRAYDESDSTYRRWPSAKIVSNARLDFPEPDRPVNTISESRGSSRLTSRRLCSRAPRMTNRSANATSSTGMSGLRRTQGTRAGAGATLVLSSDKNRPRGGLCLCDHNLVDRRHAPVVMEETDRIHSSLQRKRDRLRLAALCDPPELHLVRQRLPVHPHPHPPRVVPRPAGPDEDVGHSQRVRPSGGHRYLEPDLPVRPRPRPLAKVIGDPATGCAGERYRLCAAKPHGLPLEGHWRERWRSARRRRWRRWRRRSPSRSRRR